MIDNYLIDPGQGYEHQVGLYVQGEEQAVRQFYWALQKAGFKCFTGKKIPDRANFSHFAYVSMRDESQGKSAIAAKLSSLCEKFCESRHQPTELMIDDYYIDPRQGEENQVGLYVQGEEQAMRQFYRALQQAGFGCARGRKTPSRAEFNHFAYVSMRDNVMDKLIIARELFRFCKQYCPSCASSRDAPDYDTWCASFNAYIQTYQSECFDDQPGVSLARIFDKAYIYNLIASAHYDEAEAYLQHFADNVSSVLVPIFGVYLYHEWQRPGRVTAIHNRHEDLFRASDLDHRVVMWIAEAYLAQEQPRCALNVLDEFLPEFQRQGVADELLKLRGQVKEQYF